jgi:endonuclease-3
VAHLILQVGFGQTSGIAVDTHVHRISNRLGFVEYTNNPTKTMERLMQKFDKKYWEEINLNLVGFGQLVCGKARPKCDICPVREDCALGMKLKDIEEIAEKKKKLSAPKSKKGVKND